MIELEKEFHLALDGRTVWLGIKEKHHFVNADGLVLFPSQNMILNREAASMLPAYKKKIHLDKIVAVTDAKETADFILALDDRDIKCEQVEKGEMEALLKYYRLGLFCSHISVVSLEEPYGGEVYLRESGVALSDFVMSAIYKVR